MDVRKISCAVLVAVAACLSVAVAADPAPAQGPEAGGPGPSMAPSDSADGAAETLPVMGSLVVASLVSFLAYYWH